MISNNTNIILCGFMGSGKTTVGRLIGAGTGRKFVDMDSYIETKAGLTVSELFEQEGEDGFRKRESTACSELSLETGTVIATGGAAVINPENHRVLAKTGLVVFLDVPLAVLQKRLKGDKSRPLLGTANIAALYEMRRPIYIAGADIVIKADSPPEKVAKAVINEINALGKSNK